MKNGKYVSVNFVPNTTTVVGASTSSKGSGGAMHPMQSSMTISSRVRCPLVLVNKGPQGGDYGVDDQVQHASQSNILLGWVRTSRMVCNQADSILQSLFVFKTKTRIFVDSGRLGTFITVRAREL